MNSNNNRADKSEGKIINKTFYKFTFNFIAVITGVLLFLIIISVAVGVQ